MQGFVVLVASTVLIYFLLTLIPGGPLSGLRQCATCKISQADINRLGFQMGINDEQGHKYPWYERYARWLFDPNKKGVDMEIGPIHVEGSGILTGDWGRSIAYAQGVQVTEMIKQRLPFTIILTLTALIFSLIVAIPIGIISAVKQYSKLDYAVTLFSFFGLSMPVFWFGWMLIILFAIEFKQWHDAGIQLPWMSTSTGPLPWLPYLPSSSAYDPGKEDDIINRMQHLIMPVIVLSLIQVAGWSRFLRSSVLEVLRLDYVRTAWAKGLTQRGVILKHAVRNALIPLITVMSLALPGLFGGAIITETVFSYPGMGLLYFNSLGSYDWPIVMGFLLILTLLTVMANLLADVLYSIADPRIRYS